MPAQRETFFTLRRLLLSVIFSFTFLGIGWSIFWYIVHGVAVRELDTALRKEAQAGRTWTCDDIVSSGYPLSIEIVCNGLSVVAEMEGRNVVAHARKASVQAALHAPKRVSINIEPPADVFVAGVLSKIDLTWRTLQFSARGLPDKLDRLSAAGSDLEIKSGDLAPTMISLFQSNIRRAVGAADSAFNYEFSIGGIRSRLLDSTLGGDQLALIAGVGSVTRTDRAATGTLKDRIEQWRQAGGRLVINQITLLKGDFAIHSEGALGLDQARRLDGKLDVRLQNAVGKVSDVARNLGAVGPIAGALIGSVLPVDRQTGEMRLAIAFENGRLGIGPIKGIVSLPPLY